MMLKHHTENKPQYSYKFCSVIFMMNSSEIEDWTYNIQVIKNPILYAGQMLLSFWLWHVKLSDV